MIGRMRVGVVAFVAVVVAACGTAATTGYGVATDERSRATQTADTQIALTIKKQLLESKVKGTGSLDTFCRNGVVVLAGVVERGSAAGSEAVTIARRVDDVKRVETYFVTDQPSSVSDFAIKQKINARLIGDGDLKAGQVDMAVIAGHVVVAVRAAGTNRGELIRGAQAKAGTPASRAGTEFAGEITALGDGVKSWKPGDRVMGRGVGSYAEYLAVDQRALMRIPDGMSWAAAAAIPNVFVTAHDALVTNALVAP